MRKERRTIAYTVRYSRAEADAVEASAAHCSLEVASFVRMVSVRYARAEAAARPRELKKKGKR